MATKTNQGFKYESDLALDYSAFNAKHSGRGPGMDLSFTLNKRPINVELKFTNTPSSAKNINYGQSVFAQLPNGNWEFTSTGAEGEERRELLRSIGILDFINQKWGDKLSTYKEKIKQANSRQERQSIAKQERRLRGALPRVGLIKDQDAIKYSAKNIEFIQEEEYPFSNLWTLKNAVQSYYARKGADYVQIKNFGLYRLSNNDPIGDMSKGQIQIPKFEATNVLVRIRLKATGSENKGTRGYSWFAVLEAYGFPSNQIRITETIQKELNENRKLSYKVGKHFNSDLDDKNFKEYLTFLNQSS